MKFSAQEEYGLRCLLAIGRHPKGSITISEVARGEGLTEPYVAKLISVLRKEGFVTSTRGQSGGYTLAREPSELSVPQVLEALGGRLYEPGFCDRYSGHEAACTHNDDCSLRPLWKSVQVAIDRVLHDVTLAHLLDGDESFEPPIQLTAAPRRRAEGLS